jgi:hypothetical protein
MNERILKHGYRAPSDKSKWVDQSGFKNFVAGPSTGVFGNANDTYVARSPSQAPLLHKFRETESKSFLYGEFKF